MFGATSSSRPAGSWNGSNWPSTLPAKPSSSPTSPPATREPTALVEPRRFAPLLLEPLDDAAPASPRTPPHRLDPPLPVHDQHRRRALGRREPGELPDQPGGQVGVPPRAAPPPPPPPRPPSPSAPVPRRASRSRPRRPVHHLAHRREPYAWAATGGGREPRSTGGSHGCGGSRSGQREQRQAARAAATTVEVLLGLDDLHVLDPSSGQHERGRGLPFWSSAVPARERTPPSDPVLGTDPASAGVRGGVEAVEQAAGEAGDGEAGEGGPQLQRRRVTRHPQDAEQGLRREPVAVAGEPAAVPDHRAVERDAEPGQGPAYAAGAAGERASSPSARPTWWASTSAPSLSLTPRTCRLSGL